MKDMESEPLEWRQAWPRWIPSSLPRAFLQHSKQSMPFACLTRLFPSGQVFPGSRLIGQWPSKSLSIGDEQRSRRWKSEQPQKKGFMPRTLQPAADVNLWRGLEAVVPEETRCSTFSQGIVISSAQSVTFRSDEYSSSTQPATHLLIRLLLLQSTFSESIAGNPVRDLYPRACLTRRYSAFRNGRWHDKREQVEQVFLDTVARSITQFHWTYVWQCQCLQHGGRKGKLEKSS